AGIGTKNDAVVDVTQSAEKITFVLVAAKGVARERAEFETVRIEKTEANIVGIADLDPVPKPAAAAELGNDQRKPVDLVLVGTFVLGPDRNHAAQSDTDALPLVLIGIIG